VKKMVKKELVPVECEDCFIDMVKTNEYVVDGRNIWKCPRCGLEDVPEIIETDDYKVNPPSFDEDEVFASTDDVVDDEEDGA